MRGHGEQGAHYYCSYTCRPSMTSVADCLLLLGLNERLKSAQIAAAKYLESRQESRAEALCTELTKVQQLLQHLPNAAIPLAAQEEQSEISMLLALSPASSTSPSETASQEQLLPGQGAQDVTIDSIDSTSSPDFGTPIASPNASNNFDGTDDHTDGEETLQHVLNNFAAMDIKGSQIETAKLKSSGLESPGSQKAWLVVFDSSEAATVGLTPSAVQKDCGDVVSCSNEEFFGSASSMTDPRPSFTGTSGEQATIIIPPDSDGALASPAEDFDARQKACRPASASKWSPGPAYQAHYTYNATLSNDYLVQEDDSPLVAQSTLRKGGARFVISDEDTRCQPTTLTFDDKSQEEITSDSPSTEEPTFQYCSPSLVSVSSESGSSAASEDSDYRPQLEEELSFRSLDAVDSSNLNASVDNKAQSDATLPGQTEQSGPLQTFPKPNSMGKAFKHTSIAAFRHSRGSLVAQYFAEFNKACFKDQLPCDLQITWNVNLKTTAGLTHYKREIMAGPERPCLKYLARVELSSKVVDSPHRLRCTLLHELCHVAAWLIDHIAKPPHGQHFKKWAELAVKAFPELQIATCHNYDIHMPFQWRCTNEICGQLVKRHSNSIDINKKVCGCCNAKLEYLGKFNADGTPAAKRGPSQFSLFVKDKFSAVKQQLPPGSTHAEIMKTLSSRWKDAKQSPQSTRRPLEELNLQDGTARPLRLFD